MPTSSVTDRGAIGYCRFEEAHLRIAKPILLVTTPLGVAWGLLEAHRFDWRLAVLMAAMVSVVGAFVAMTVRRIRSEARAGREGRGG